MSTVTMPRGIIRGRGRSRRPDLPEGTAESAVRRSGRRARLLRIGVVFAMVAAMLAAVMVVFALSAHAETKNEYSLYKLSSATSSYFGNAQSPESESGEIGQGWLAVSNSAGSAGSFLGYPDADKNPVLKWLSSQLSGSSVTYNYESFTQGKVVVKDGGDSQNTAMLNYAYFGAALNELGLDSTSTLLSIGITNLVGGSLMLFFFVVVAAVDMVFWGLLWIMKIFNPFALFYEGVTKANAAVADQFGLTPMQPQLTVFGTTFNNPLVGLSSFIGDWYSALYNLSLALVPIFIAVLIVTVLFFRKANVGGKFKRFMVRFVFILVGIPILGGLYTGTLNSLMDHMGNKGGSMGATKVVLSTYVDFESWATINRLYVPTGGNPCTAKIAWMGYKSEPDPMSRMQLRKTALCINQITGAYGDVGTLGSSDSQSVTDQWNFTGSDGGTKGATDSGSVATGNTVGLLLRYIKGSHLSASDFETGFQAELTPKLQDKTARDQAKVWFVDYTDMDQLSKAKPGAAVGTNKVESGNPVVALNKDKGLKVDYSGYPDFSAWSGTEMKCGYQVMDKGRDCNMSALAMYNYLNTSFGPKSMTVYSSEKSSSGMIREQHNSVNQIGTGLMGFMYWFNSVVVLATFAIVGIFYAIAMVIGNLKRSIQAISSVPFAMLGAVNSIAKVITYGVAMIVELVGTVFIYMLMQEIMLSLPQIIEMPLSGLLSKDGTQLVGAAAALATGGWLVIVMLLLSSVFMIWFCAVALKIRKGFISGVNEAVTKAIEKFTDGQVAPPSMRGPSMAGALAGGAASGLGMAAAGRAMAGASGATKSPSSLASGPGGITSGSKGIASGAAGGLNGPGPMGAAADGPGGPDAGPGGDNVSAVEGDSNVGGDQLSLTSGPDGAVDDRGNPIAASGEDPGLSKQVAGSDDEDRDTAAAVAARGGLSTSDEPGQSGDQKAVAAGMPAGEAMDPNTKASTAEEISKEKDEARGDQLKSGGKAVVGGAETAVGAYAGNADMVKDGAERTAEGAKDVKAGQERAAAANDKIGSDGKAGDPKPGAPKSGDPSSKDAPKGKQLATDGSGKAAAAGAGAGALAGAGAAAGAAGKGGKTKGLPTGQKPAPGGQGGTQQGQPGQKAKQSGQSGQGAPANSGGDTRARRGQPAASQQGGQGSGRPAAGGTQQGAAGQAPRGQRGSQQGQRPQTAGGTAGRPQGTRPAQAPQQRPAAASQRGAQPQAQAPRQGQAANVQPRPGQTNVNVNAGGNRSFTDNRGRVSNAVRQGAQRARDYASTPEGKAVIANAAASAISQTAQTRQQQRDQKSRRGSRLD